MKKSRVTENLTPYAIWKYFEEITQIPRPSKKEEKIRNYLMSFAQTHNLTAKQDKAGNIVICKPASQGMEERPTVVLQSHMDMVCEKNNDVVFDFENDPINIYIDGTRLRAKGTTLGADNGIGVAAELAILTDDTLQHGPLECLFTVDEETGLTGAYNLEENLFTGKFLINLDSEDEGELFIGCAGGIDTTIQYPYQTQEADSSLYFFTLEICGLNGGHSGGDIHKGLANANKLLARYLQTLIDESPLYIADIKAGNLRNAIAREAFVKAAVPFSFKERVRILLNLFVSEIEQEFAGIEEHMQFKLETADGTGQVMTQNCTATLVKALLDCPHGVINMSKEIEGLVETSTNLASVRMHHAQKTIEIVTSQRSAIESEKRAIAQKVHQVFEEAGATVTHGEGYPGWSPNLQSPLLRITQEAYRNLFQKEPKVKAIHAGLECGLFLQKYPGLDMISFGPTLQGVHSPDECIEIPTVELFWQHLIEVLRTIK